MSESINAVKTRVIRVSEGQFMPQLSTDGMMWFDLYLRCDWDKNLAISTCELIRFSTGKLPSTGEVVHSS